MTDPRYDDEGNCIACDGSGHDQNHDGQLCRVCGGAGKYEPDDEDDGMDEFRAARDERTREDRLACDAERAPATRQRR